MRSAKLKRTRQSLEAMLAVGGVEIVVLFSSPRHPEKERSVASIQGRACRTSDGPKHCRVHLVGWQVLVVQPIHGINRDSLSLQPYPRHTQSFADSFLGIPAYDLRWGATRYFSFM